MYPNSVAGFTATHANGQIIEAAHPNSLEQEVVAIETELGTNPAGSTFNTVADRLDGIDDDIAAKLPLSGGTMSGNIAMGGSSVTGLPAPTDGSHAANKTYVDDTITNALPDEKMPLVTALLFSGI